MANEKLELFKSTIEKSFGKKNSIFVKDPANIVLERFSSGSYLLDRDLKGGYVKGTIIELVGKNQSGKTTLCIHAVAEHQKKYPDETVLWIDLESVFDPTYFSTIGIDVQSENFMLVQPVAGEDVWETILTYVKIMKKGIVVLDSMALILPKKEDEDLMEDTSFASAARLNSKALRKILPHMERSGTTIFIINQIRESMSAGYGDTTVGTGGNALPHYARTRIKASRSKGEPGEYAIHKYTQVKSNYGIPDRVTTTSIEFGLGFNKVKELVKLCVESDIIHKGGSWFSYGDTKLGQGEDNVVELLRDNIELQDELLNKLKEKGIL